MRPFDPRLLRAAPAARRPGAVLAVVGVLPGIATIGLAVAATERVFPGGQGMPLGLPAPSQLRVFRVVARPSSYHG